ncbi:beta-ketoacyl synthase N-terminal-like domain-containing protein [Amycolatopsis thailandensis]|uniref:beta-ketoacyl synthase N-terminal-like domain-containing protein n=1 Tax=Amycolatopsis thailandensis TaxID=589330 RepID=UPI00363FD555
MTPVAEPIAITGMAVRLPDADSLRRFHRNLAEGKDSVREVPAERLRLAGADPGLRHRPLASLTGVEEFDHEFFGIPLREAELMDPQHRLCLQLACAAIEDSGHPLGSVRGTRTAVVMAGGRSDYAELMTEADEGVLTLLGTGTSVLPGRIAHLLGTQGPALVVDTGCSTGLVALDLAAGMLRGGQASLAVVGGVAVRSTFADASDDRYAEVVSASGRCRAFDAAADGTGDGEGGVVLVLKLLSDAVRDRDHVHAVVRSTAVNHNGDRSNGLSAPSPAAQVNLLRDAWEKAGLRPGQLGYLEAHGSGTRLGDLIEVEAVSRACGEPEPGRESRVIGSVKTNIGHLDHVAGLAGLVKVVAGIQNRVIYPSLHFTRPNPLVDFDRLGVRVATELVEWKADDDGPLFGGVSSFSLAGTNAHAVLESAPAAPSAGGEPSGWAGGVATVSGRGWPAVARVCAALRERIADDPGLDVRDVLHTLNRGRDHLPWRVAFPVRDRAGLLDGLRRAGKSAGRGGPAPSGARRPMWTVVPGAGPSARDADLLAGRYAVYAAAVAECAEAAPDEVDEDTTAWFSRNHAFLRLMRTWGIDTTLVSGSLALAKLARGESSLSEALAEAMRSDDGEHGSDDPGGDLVVCDLDSVRGDDVLARVAELYVSGVDVDWDLVHEGTGRRRVSLPGYSFEPTRCWVTPPPRDTAPPAPSLVPPRPDRPPTSRADYEQALARVWTGSLRVGEVPPDADYFELGGTSVLALQVLADIRRELGVRLRLRDIYAHRTLRDLAGFMAASAGHDPAATGRLVPIRAGGEHPPLFCPHPSGGGVQPYFELARALPAGYPVIGVPAVGLDDGLEPDPTVEAMATRYVGELRQVQPTGPYRLVGWSFGAVIAYEMARRLSAEGDRVATLVLIDANTELDPGPPPEQESALLINLLTAGSDFRVDTGALAGLSERERLTAVVKTAKEAGRLPTAMTRHQIGAMTKVLRANDLALLDYRWAGYAGPATVIRAESPLFDGPDDRAEDLGWRKFITGEVTVHSVPGDHFTMMRRHHTAIADIIGRVL